MRRLFGDLFCGLLALRCLVGDAGAATAVLDRYAGPFAVSGIILEGANANSH
jgi:hypothetical protein